MFSTLSDFSWTTFKCLFKWEFFAKVDGHSEHLRCFSFSWTHLTWFLKPWPLKKALVHLSHLNDLIFRCTPFMWYCNWFLLTKEAEHSVHLWGFTFKCLNAMCLFSIQSSFQSKRSSTQIKIADKIFWFHFNLLFVTFFSNNFNNSIFHGVLNFLKEHFFFVNRKKEKIQEF